MSFSEKLAPLPLRTKITGVTVLMLTFGLFVTGIGTMSMVRPILEDQLDSQLRATANTKQINAYLSEEQEEPDPSGDKTYPDHFVALYDTKGNFVRSNWTTLPEDSRPNIPHQLTPGQLGIETSHAFPMQSQDKTITYRAVLFPVNYNSHDTPPGYAILAVTAKQIDTIVISFLAIYIGFAIIVIIVGAGLTRMLVITAFTPLRKAEQTAAAIAEGDLSQRLGDTNPNTEVGRLNKALNAMLGHIDEAFEDRARTIEQMRRFVGDASHELRTPLVSLRGYAELYKMGALRTPEEITQAMDRIEKEATRMGSLVQDLLELARLDEAKPLEISRFDLVRVARDTALDAIARSPERRIQVLDAHHLSTNVSEHSDQTPQTDKDIRTEHPLADIVDSYSLNEHVYISGNENKIRQIATNLLGNALRYTPEGTDIEIAAYARTENQEAILEVRDHGPGIPPELRQKIFQRFWRADTSRTRETGGSGLGLAIVSSIASLHKGSVSVIETPGGGATFRVCLPLSPNQDPSEN